MRGGEAAFEHAQRQWKRNPTRYKVISKRVARKLGFHGKFFTEPSPHDGSLLLFAVRDWPVPASSKRYVIPETRVEIAVLAGGKEALIYQLSYSGVIPNCIVPATASSPAHFAWSGLIDPFLIACLVVYCIWFWRFSR